MTTSPTASGLPSRTATALREARTLELSWPFTGREEELELVRRSSTATRHGIVVTGPAGCGKTRLVDEAVRGTQCVRAAGSPGSRDTPFAAFAHLLPESVTLHRAVHLLSGARLLVVDDAHLLDDASAALVHQLAVHTRTRLIVVVTDGAPAPGAIQRLRTGELLPRLALEPPTGEDTDRLLAAGAPGPVEPLTARRLRRLSGGDLALLRDLMGAVRDKGLLTADPDTGEHTWHGPLPLTPAVRERAAPVLGRTDPAEREILDRLAFAEPLPLDAADCDLSVLERLEADGLIRVTEDPRTPDAVRLAHPLHGPVLRAAAGRLRARRLARTAGEAELALKTEAAALERLIEEADVRETPTPAGEWLEESGTAAPAAYAAVRARFARLRGELREAAAWSRLGLRDTPGDPVCRLELDLAVAQSGGDDGCAAPQGAAAPGGPGGCVRAAGGATGAASDREAAQGPRPSGPCPGDGAEGPAARETGCPRPSGPFSRAAVRGPAAAWSAAARGDLDGALAVLDARRPYDAVRLGAPDRALGLLPAGGVFAAHAEALARADASALDRVAGTLGERGFLLFAAEAHAQAARAHRDPLAARTSRARAVALARRCQGARTPALTGLVLGELTARQRQIVTLAAAGLSNRQIAERLTLSVRTVGNHLYGAYTRLGGDRRTLPCLMAEPDAKSA
ncbi:LuxR C-terminal-related transcriptional regulator [Streptomyces sp. NPDC093094]|uniref:helix-turn-helix transcriptional regulator n=1 Tax=Streptomyces sp. NPDC093094 TaxID=3366026 RepID=UPI00380E6C29